MNSGMYAALSGNLNMLEKLSVTANNLANINTIGFKKDRAYFERVLDTVNNPTLDRQDGSGVPVQSSLRTYTDYSNGSIKQTGGTFHVALDGDGFFAVNTPEGVAYTRQGNFQRDKDGKLTTTEGYEVRGRGGAALTVAGNQVKIDSDGNIYVDGAMTAALEVVDFPKPYDLRKIGKAMFLPADPQLAPQPVQKPSVLQGCLEGSNVSAITEMTVLIETSRSFESCQKAVRSYDDMSGKAIELGKL
jgi:flagellar basal-body rod protein FlgF